MNVMSNFPWNDLEKSSSMAVTMTRKKHLLRHYFFQTNEGDVVVASK
jgi:hypothetical protein